ELQVDGGQFEPALTSLAITDVRVGAHGFALVRREQLNSLLQVTSTKNLALVVPGHGDKGFDDLALKAKRVKGTVVVSDPQLKRKELKDVSIFSIGALKVVGSPEFAPQPSVEIAVLAAKANFDADARNWSNFAANARAEFRRLVVSCLAPEHHSRLEMYAFKKLSDSAHRVIVRVPQDAALEFLAKSAVGHSLTFQAVWRDEAHKEFLDSVFCVEWLGPKSLPDARAVLLRIAKHFGLQQNRTGFGVRVPIVEVAEARKILKPNDSRFNDSNRHLVGRIRYFVYGLPDGTSRAEVAKLLLDKLQLAALVGGPLRRGGHLVFPVAIDQEPNKDTFELSTGLNLLVSRILLLRPLHARLTAIAYLRWSNGLLTLKLARSSVLWIKRSDLSGGGGPRSASNEANDFAEAVRQSLRQNDAAVSKWRTARVALKQRVPENFKLSLVPGDGNCLFEAVARAANFILPTRCTAAGLRHDCVQTIQQVSLFRDRFADDLDLSNFCKGMAREATYGDELCALSSVFTLLNFNQCTLAMLALVSTSATMGITTMMLKFLACLLVLQALALRRRPCLPCRLNFKMPTRCTLPVVGVFPVEKLSS
ncbi:unnamed protein product, partial [Symbiodinium natans]